MGLLSVLNLPKAPRFAGLGRGAPNRRAPDRNPRRRRRRRRP